MATTTNQRGKKNPGRKLTPEQVDEQMAYSLRYRELLTEAVSDYLEVVKAPAIFLSGGVDSTVLLLAMLDCGAKPLCATFGFQGSEKLHTDAKKSQKAAQAAGLPFAYVEIPRDPEQVSTGIRDISGMFELDKMDRPTLEVMWLMDRMIASIAESNPEIDSIFSGICDGNVGLLGRELEIRGIKGAMTAEEADMRRITTLDNAQAELLHMIAAEYKMMACLPQWLVSAILPFQGASWHLVNTPKLKSIITTAWEPELKRYGLNPRPSPMQCGNTGAREFFDTMISQSETARSICGGRFPNTAMQFYNALNKAKGLDSQDEPSEDDEVSKALFVKGSRDLWNGFTRSVAGPDFPVYPPDWEPPWPLDPKTGLAEPPPLSPVKNAIADEDVLISLDEPQKSHDCRVDCFGSPAWRGEGSGYYDCPRAAAGYCGTTDGGAPYDPHACTIFEVAVDGALYRLECAIEIFKEAKFKRAAMLLEEWHAKSKARHVELRKQGAFVLTWLAQNGPRYTEDEMTITR